MQSFVLLLSLLFSVASALYSAKSDVVIATDKTFRDEVLKFPGVVVVEFFAPWYFYSCFIFRAFCHIIFFQVWSLQKSCS